MEPLLERQRNFILVSARFGNFATSSCYIPSVEENKVENSKKYIGWFTGFLAILVLISSTGTAQAAPVGSILPDVTEDQPVLDFPNTITFQAQLASAAQISSVVLEYGDSEQTCGQVVAKAFPQITPGSSVHAQWTWDMRQSGSLPPGAQIWWRWRITDSAGQEMITDQKSIVWLDDVHHWQSLSKGDIQLHWYESSRGFAQQLLDAAYNGLARIEKDAGLSQDQPIDLYIYPNSTDMQDAVLYEPSWTGGEAFPSQNIVIIGIDSSQLDWGSRAEVHELTHVLVGHFAFSCLGGLPRWLDEGLAMYSEGPLDPQFQQPLDQAIRSDTLLSVRSMSGPFSGDSGQADLSYAEADSLVSFLLQGYGQEKMTALLVALRDGSTTDEALTSVYGFDVEGLEDAWRASIGAKARPVALNPTAMPTPTYVPTIVPVSAALQAITPTPYSYPTPVPAPPARQAPPLSLTLMLLCTCIALAVVLGVLVLGFVLARENRKGGQNEPRP